MDRARGDVTRTRGEQGGEEEKEGQEGQREG